MNLDYFSTRKLEQVSQTHILNAIDFLQIHRKFANFKNAKSCYLIYPNYDPLAVKMVFGKALSLCFGNAPVRAEHFNSRMAIEILQARGFKCVNTQPQRTGMHLQDEGPVAEGAIQLKSHFYRERNSALAQRKKQFFKMRHGFLFCEICGLEPIEAFGEYGESCIEVHHKTPLGSLPGTSQTTLDDLQCLCANCHRIAHAKIRQGSS